MDEEEGGDGEGKEMWKMRRTVLKTEKGGGGRRRKRRKKTVEEKEEVREGKLADWSKWRK